MGSLSSLEGDIRRKAEIHAQLLALGWSIQEIGLAFDLEWPVLYTYDYNRYANWFPPKTIGDILRGYFQGWQRHWYRQLKVAELGWSADEFVLLWRALLRKHLYEDAKFYSLPSWQIAGRYVRACRGGLPDEEARAIIHYSSDSFDTYLTLRRKLSRKAVLALLEAARKSERPWVLQASPSLVNKAFRRGMSLEELLERLKSGTINRFGMPT